jgi:hypothetical protein
VPTVNERLADEAIAHAEQLHRYSNGVVNRLIALLNRADAELAGRLLTALERMPVAEWSVERLEGLLQSVRTLNVAAYAAVDRELSDELKRFIEYEASHQLELFRATVPAQVITQVGVAAVNVEQVYAAAMARPFQGRLLKEWAASLEEGRMARIRDAVRMGFVQQEGVPEIVRRIRGTRAKAYTDGAIDIDRRHLEAVVRTAISHTAGFVRDRFFEANGDLVKAQAWNSTLDTRTSEICALRDGKEYQPVSPYKPIGHQLPWMGGPGRAHWNCRSSAVPVLKSWRELGVDIAEFDPQTRASMDGQVPQDLSYGAWLKRQSAARQDAVLGAARGKLLRDGGLTLERFANDKGRWLTLDELKQLDAAAFKRAGL